MFYQRVAAKTFIDNTKTSLKGNMDDGSKSKKRFEIHDAAQTVTGKKNITKITEEAQITDDCERLLTVNRYRKVGLLTIGE